MALIEEMMQGGMSSGQANAIMGFGKADVSAAGTTQGTATALTRSHNVITTAAASSGVQLPNCVVGGEVDVLNLGANPVTVYPPTSAQINSLSVNTGFTLAQNTTVRLRKFSATRWMGWLSA